MAAVTQARGAPWWIRERAVLRSLERRMGEDRSLGVLNVATDDGGASVSRWLGTHGFAVAATRTYGALAEGPWGRYRLAAIFPGSPTKAPPRALCLDGPIGAAAGPHRFDDLALCLYMPSDPPERRWRLSSGVIGLMDLARRHVAAEYFWQRDGEWVIDEAPHGTTPPAPAAVVEPRVHADERPGRNDPCPCGSGLKAKKCCAP